MIKIHDKAVTELMPKIGVRNFAVLLVIVKHMNKDRTAFPSRARIQKLTKLGRDSVKKSLTELVKFGLLERQQRTVEGGKFGSMLYTVKSELFGGYYGKPDTPQTEKPSTVQPSTVQPSTVQPSTVQPSTVNQSTKYKPSIEVQISKEVQIRGGSSKKGENETAAANPPFPKNGRAMPTGATSANAPKEKSSGKKEKVIWSESEYTGAEGLERLENDLIGINPDYDLVDVDYYRERVVVWSMTAKHSKFDWLGLIHKIIREDSNQQKLKTKPHVRQKSNNEVILDNLNRVLAAKGY